MIQMNCHLLCWWPRVWTNLAGSCSKIWRNRPTWCFLLSACQLLLLCSPLVPRGTLSNRWSLGILSNTQTQTQQTQTQTIKHSQTVISWYILDSDRTLEMFAPYPSKVIFLFLDNRIAFSALSFGNHGRVQVQVEELKHKTPQLINKWQTQLYLRVFQVSFTVIWIPKFHTINS